MKVKILTAVTPGGLERAVNKFISTEGIEVIDIKLSTSALDNTVLVMYEEMQIEYRS